MHFLSVSLPDDWYPRLRVSSRRGLAAAQIAVDLYISDVKAALQADIQRKIDDGLASNDQTDVDCAKDRARCLRIWLRSEYPLGYGDVIYPALLRILTPHGSPPTMRLGNEQSMSTRELAHLCYSMSRSDKPIPLQAPFFAKAPHAGVFRVAVSYMLAQASAVDMKDPPAFIMSAIAQIFEDRHVAHVPWSAPPLPNRRPGRRVNFLYWRGTGKDVELGERALMRVVDADEQAHLAGINVAREASLRDPTAPWALHNLTIGQLPSIMHKRRLPSDFDINDATLQPDGGYVTKTYEWLVDHYDGASPLHRFALLVGHMFSRMAPNLNHGPLPTAVSGRKVRAATITAEVRRSPWLYDVRRGLTAREPFVTMITTYIIAMSDPTSPLMQHLEFNSQTFGVWAKKHGEPVPLMLDRYLIAPPPFISNQTHRCF